MNIIQRSFSSGEVTPLYWLRSELGDKHDGAVGKMLNMYADPHGPAIGRQGFEFKTELESEDVCRLFSYNISFTESYIIAITTGNIYILGGTGFTLSDEFVYNWHFDISGDPGDGWTEDNVVFEFHKAILTPLAVNSARLRQEITVTNPIENHLFKVKGLVGDTEPPYRIKVGTTEGDSDIYLEENILSRDVEFQLVPGITTFWLEVEVDMQQDDDEVDIDTIQWVDSISVREVLEVTGMVTFPSPYTEQDIRELQVEDVPGNRIKYFFTRGVAPQELTYDDSQIWEFKPIEFEFDERESPPWDNEFPGCITFHDGRMAVGGTYSKPVHIWLSKPRQYTDFSFGEAGYDDALELPLDKHGELVWLRSNTKLFAGLDTGEHILFGSSGPINLDNAQTEQQSTYGSSRIHAFIIDEKIGYIGSNKEAVRLMDYSDEAKAYKSNNITFQAEHITKSKILEVQHAIYPRGLIYLVMEDGKMVIANIEDDQGILGWHRHETQGSILSMVVTKELGREVPWIAVRRKNRLFIERLDIDDNYYLDSYTTVTVEIATEEFSGFEHLAGSIVQVIADGKIHHDVEVDLIGNIILDYPALIVTVGLGYDCVLETLPQQNDSQSGDNTLNYTKRFTELFLYIVDSARPVVNGYDTFLRFAPTPMGKREDNESGILSFSSDAGWSKEAIITVEQNLPLPLRIHAIGGKIKANKA